MDGQGWWEAAVVVELDTTIADGFMRHRVGIPAGCCEEATIGARVEGALDDARFSRVVTATPTGERILRFGRDWLRRAGIEVGDRVSLRVRLAPDPDHVDVPDELTAALADDPALEHRWESLTPGRRRTLVHPIEGARRPETRERRIRAVLDVLRAEG